MTAYRVALSADFLKPDGTPALADFDLAPLKAEPNIEIGYVEAVNDIIPASALDAYDALILFAHQMRRASLPQNGRLGVVARFGVGYDSVDVDALADTGVATTITPGGVQRPVAVAILALILALSNKLLTKDRLARRGADGFADPSIPIGTGLTGKRLGTIGLGNIGVDMVNIMRPLGLDFIAHDPGIGSERALELGVRLVDLDTLFRDSDIVTVNCPLTPGTRGLVNAKRLALMKMSAILINTARGPIVDQSALTEALRSGRIAGAGLDVFSPEPPDASDPLLKLDNVVLAPHSLAMTDELIRACGALTIKSVLDVMHGREPKAIVQRSVTSHPSWSERLARNRSTFG